MRVVRIVTLAIVLGASGTDGRRIQQSAPFVAVAVWYPAGPAGGPVPTDGDASPSVRARRIADLGAIKAAGFNSIRTAVHWSAVEAERGKYTFGPLQEILSAAAGTGLKVIVQIEAAAAPGWLARRYADAAVVTQPGRHAPISTAGYCQDHPGVRADLASFIGAAATAAASHDSFYAVDVWRNPGISSSTSARSCYCPHTLARFRTALQQKYGTLGVMNGAWGRAFPVWSAVHPPTAPSGPAPQTTAMADWRQFIARKLQQDLKFRADASAPRGTRPVSSHSESALQGDAWLMNSAVDHFGASLQRADVRRHPAPYSAFALLDLTRSAARDRSWWLGALPAGRTKEEAHPATDEDLRVWSWAAISRGAGAISFDDWAALNGGGGGLHGASSALRAAGEFAGVVGRNSGLFSRLRPHPARVAMLQDADFPGPTGKAVGVESNRLGGVYRALVDRNIVVDFIHADEVLAGAAASYDVVYTPRAALASGPLSDALKGFVAAGGTLLAAPTGEPAAPRRVRPEIGIEPMGGLVEARFLESADALVLVAINHGPTPRTVTLAFAPDVPEAIWQNLETGAAVSFVQSPSGPTYRRAFAARDVLVLVRGKRLR